MFKPVRFFAIAVALVLVGTIADAQQSPVTRTIMQKVEFPGDQYTSMLVAVSIAPSGKAPLHTHPGIEMGYVVDGDAELYVEGSPDRHITAGDSFQIPAGVPHRVDNLNPDKPLKLVATYVVEKDKPLVTSVPK